MYQPAHSRFIERDPVRLHRLIRENPLGTLVSHTDTGDDANHLPFLLHGGSPDTLAAHVPRANPIWKAIADRSELAVLVIFHGPDAYISPSWYPSKQAHGRAVPTWNYAVVHVRGSARVIDDRAWLRRHLEELTAVHERGFDQPWKIADAPDDYIETLLGSIVGIEIAVGEMQGKFKLGQNRPAEDRASVVRALDRYAPALAALTKEHEGTN